MEEIKPGKTIILNTHLNTTFIASGGDLGILDYDKYKGKFEWAGELSISINKKEELSDFLDWVHNNWYIPFGSDGQWKLDVDNEEYTLPIPPDGLNCFDSDYIASRYLNGEGMS